jgi:aquaporin TIP
MAKIALGTTREATQPDCIQALIVEFIATFLFVFAGVGSAMTAGIYIYIYIAITLIFII